MNEHSESTRLRVLITGSDCILRRGFASILCDVVPCSVFVQASCFHDAKERLGCEAFSAAIFDIDAEDQNGPISFQMLRADHPQLILGVFSHVDNASVILNYLAAGVNGYILGCSSQSEIEHAIGTMLRGAIYIPPSLVRPNADQSNYDPGAPPPCQNLRGLTGRQSTVLNLLLNGRSNKEIARELHLSPHTVKIHVGAVLRHFAVRRRTDLAIAAREQENGAYRYNAPQPQTQREFSTDIRSLTTPNEAGNFLNKILDAQETLMTVVEQISTRPLKANFGVEISGVEMTRADARAMRDFG